VPGATKRRRAREWNEHSEVHHTSARHIVRAPLEDPDREATAVELSNVVALVRHARGGDRHLAAYRLSYLCSSYFERRGGWTSGVELMRHAVAAAERLGDEDLASVARAQLAVGLARIGDMRSAIREQQRVLVQARRSGDRLREASAINNLGWMYGQTDHHERTLATYETALALYDPRSERAYIALTLQNLGDVHSVMGNFTEAVRHHQRALDIAVEDGDVSQQADSWASIGQASSRAGDHHDAVRHYRKSLPMLAENGNQVAEALIRHELGRSYSALGDTAGAVAELTAAAQVYRGLGDQHGVACVLVDLARAHLRSGETVKARDVLDEAVTLRRQLPDPAEHDRITEVASLLSGQDDNTLVGKGSQESGRG
jgi:tetratricopeptide (TPR) repeat protein